jgi:hypothetical protein
MRTVELVGRCDGEGRRTPQSRRVVCLMVLDFLRTLSRDEHKKIWSRLAEMITEGRFL